MQSYTVHLPEFATSDLKGAEKSLFVPDGFSVGAFVFGVLWLAYKRLWLGFAAGLIVLGVIAGLGYLLHVPPFTEAGISFLINLFLGFEGNNLWRATLERNGRPAVAVVTAKREDEAEAKFFASLPVTQAYVAQTTSAPLPAFKSSGQDVIGMFPLPEVRS